MKNFIKIFVIFLSFFASFSPLVFAQTDNIVPNMDVEIKSRGETNDQLKQFAENENYGNTFIQPAANSADGVRTVFENIAYGIKNFTIFIAIIFLIIGVIKLLFSDASDEDVKKWKNNIFWTAIGIFFLQISYSIWRTGVDVGAAGGNPINAALSWKFWNNIIGPIIALLQYLAGFAFLAMMVYAFYVIVTGA